MPTQFGRMVKFRNKFDVSRNRLTLGIPTEIGKITKLVNELILNENMFR